MLNSHYKDILLILSEKKVKFLLVGAYAMAAHGYPRSTMDIDLFIMPDPDNALLTLQALTSLSADLEYIERGCVLRTTRIFVKNHN